MKRLAQMADLMGKTLAKRLEVPEPEAAYFRHMKASLDLRKMAFGPANLLMVAKPPLKRLYDWLESRFSGQSIPRPDICKPMPSFDTIWDQYEMLCGRLGGVSVPTSNPCALCPLSKCSNCDWVIGK